MVTCGSRSPKSTRREPASRWNGAVNSIVVSDPVRVPASAMTVRAARAKVRELITAALIRPRPRRATRPTRRSREQRIVGKKQCGVVKRLRATPGDWS